MPNHTGHQDEGRLLIISTAAVLTLIVIAILITFA